MKRITTSSALLQIAVLSVIIIFFSGRDCDECYATPVMIFKLFLVGLAIMLGSLYFRLKFLETEEIIFDVESAPVLHTDEATDAVPFAGEGVVESEKDLLLISPYTSTPCVYYHSVEERLVSTGKSSHWEVVSNVANFVPFYLKDDKGKLRVSLAYIDYDFAAYRIPLLERPHDPDNSEVDCLPLLNKDSYSRNGSGIFSFLSSSSYRRSEYVLSPDTPIFVYGMVNKTDEGLVLVEDERCPLIVSRKSHDDYINDFYKGVSLVYVAPMLMAAGYTLSLFSANYIVEWEAATLWMLFVAGNGLILGSFFLALYNRIVTLKERALNAEGDIDVELARRAELIPNLVETVKGYAKEEKEVQRIVAQARAEKTFSRQLSARETAVIPALSSVIENYPQLKAAVNFQSLMGAIVDAENRISYSRNFYNRNIRKYNALIGRFPYLLVAVPLSMQEMEYISIDRRENAVARVEVEIL